MSASDNNDILGRGVAFPLRLANGEVGMSAYESQVEQSIQLILGTRPGERVMRPNFGVGLDSIAFGPMDPVTAAVVKRHVREALLQFEPRIAVLNVGVTMVPEEGRLEASIDYLVTKTGSVSNFVYPFYVEIGQV